MRLGKFIWHWQTLIGAVLATIAGIAAAYVAWDAYLATVRQVNLTELAQAQGEQEQALRDFEALKSSIRRFERLRKEMVATDAAKANGTQNLDWWEIYSGWYDRGLFAVGDRETVRAGHPSIDLERAVKALHTRMDTFSSILHRDTEPLKSSQDPRGLKAYAASSFGKPAINQLESDILPLREEFIRAFNECENQVAHYRQVWEQKGDRVKLLEKQVGQ
jgi:hypothetical protein